MDEKLFPDGFAQPLGLCGSTTNETNFFQTKEKFRAQRQRDEIKQMRCAELGIILLVIPYQFSYKRPKELEKHIVSLLNLLK